MAETYWSSVFLNNNAELSWDLAGFAFEPPNNLHAKLPILLVRDNT